MSIEIKVPPLPESVSDATLVAWHKKPGDAVSRDENLVDLETDKVVLEVPAPAAGILQEIKIEDGATVTAGDVLAILEEGEAAVSEAPQQAAAAKKAPAPEVELSAKPAKTSPAVRRLLEEHDLDETMVLGTGKGGRITKADVLTFLKADDSSNVTPGDPAPVIEGGDAVVGLERTEQRVPMTRLRARIAERLIDAQQTAAMLTTFNEVDLTEVMALRSRYKESFEKEHGGARDARCGPDELR
jgi:2-oxoglutarate dehydrogenase E2 component (dihydrolipoamide succinyltransferase)